MDCIFCKIVAGEIPSKIVIEDDKVIAFNDISPAAPLHILIIPKKHINSALTLSDDAYDIISSIFKTAVRLAKEFNIAEDGFRIVNNCGKNGGQTVEHLHFHLIGGRCLTWPPG